MAVALRSKNVAAYGAHTNVTVTAPTGIANGDVLVLVLFIGSGTPPPPTPAPPAGFTLVTASPALPTDITNGGFEGRLYVWRKIAASESGNYTITHAAASSGAWMGAYSGADTSAPIASSATTDTGTSATSTALSVTPTRNGSMIVICANDWGDKTSALVAPTGTTPTFTLEYGGTGEVLYVADGVLATAAATSNKTWTNDNTSGSWTTCMFAIQPPSAAHSLVVPNRYQRNTLLRR